MKSEGEDNWINGVRVLIAELECAGSDAATQYDALKNASSTYRTMMAAKDGIGAYVIWRDDLESRCKLNADFDALRSELWNLLELVSKPN